MAAAEGIVQNDQEPSTMTNQVAWQLEHVVDVEASLSFVWAWRTDITTWDDPPARFELDGPFVSGAEGRTVLPGQPPLKWRLRDVQPLTTFVVEMPLDRAALRFEWRFDAISDGQTRLTQRIYLSGADAIAYADQVRSNFTATLADGMNRLAAMLEQAARCAEESNQ
jgi:hypothetical protein